ncbi:arylformamidase [Paenibacillus sp. UNC496MF]|uniref:cyclase family protein n=1 Tax=Paenibacillus sp. UNC496MF TaxID=1502753 RepID=UPI0008EEF79D|nr:cyclase family protein [Paenibacillus sp. UNC496MF]SFI98159.1 arylformamidase [Paenibacillus sp. UNC496MF]
MFRIYDISMTIEPAMPVYKNKESKMPKITNVACHEGGEAVYQSRLDLDAHAGTHVDAPLHMLKDGDAIETIGLEPLVGMARVADLTHCAEAVTRDDLEPLGLQRNDWVLMKTRNSYADAFEPDFAYLREDGAQYLIELGVRGIGTDALGIERGQIGYPTHRALFRNNIVVVEGLRLRDVATGSYFMVVAPLKLAGVEAAPARGFLIGGI